MAKFSRLGIFTLFISQQLRNSSKQNQGIRIGNLDMEDTISRIIQVCLKRYVTGEYTLCPHGSRKCLRYQCRLAAANFGVNGVVNPEHQFMDALQRHVTTAK